jgi:chromatin assembly factor 1 subunit A
VAAPAAVASGFDVDSFRSKINSTDEVPLFCFRNLSARAVSSRKRRTKSVAVSIFTTVTPEEGDWDAPAFAEQKTIMVPNKYRFLSFHEDCRPAYHGTWSKTSSVVTGKTPFAKETSVFDYDYDSEAEWEEGDDEIGEDVDDDAKNEEEDADEEANGLYDYNDGFCVADEQFLDNEDDADEETRELYMKKLQRGGDEQKLSSQQIQIIAPGPGGVPLHLSSKKLPIDHRIEGFDKKDVAEILSSYTGVTFCSEMKLCLDAFPQLNMDEENLSPDPSTNGNSNKDKDDYTNEVIASMARFAHHCTLNSKEKLIDELRIAHPTLFSNRAKATRKLDSIATKKKHPASTGVYWEVNKDLLLELGLVDLVVSSYSPLYHFVHSFSYRLISLY